MAVRERHLGGENAFGLVGTLVPPVTRNVSFGFEIAADAGRVEISATIFGAQGDEDVVHVYEPPPDPPGPRLVVPLARPR